MLDPRVKLLRILSQDDQIDLLPRGLDTVKRSRWPEVDEEVKFLPEGDVHASEAGADGCGQGAFEGDLVPRDRFDDAGRKWILVLLERLRAGLECFPFDGDFRSLEDAERRLADLRTDPVARKKSYFMHQMVFFLINEVIMYEK